MVDLGNSFSDLQTACIEDASSCLVVTTPEILVVNQTRRLINDLLTATFPLEMFQLVINKAGTAGLSPQAISQGLRLPVIGMIPNDDITAQGSLQRPLLLLLPHQMLLLVEGTTKSYENSQAAFYNDFGNCKSPLGRLLEQHLIRLFQVHHPLI